MYHEHISNGFILVTDESGQGEYESRVFDDQEYETVYSALYNNRKEAEANHARRVEQMNNGINPETFQEG